MTGGGVELMYSNSEEAFPEVQCKKCHLRLTSDNLAVVVKCYNCVDLVANDKKVESEYRKIYVF